MAYLRIEATVSLEKFEVEFIQNILNTASKAESKGLPSDNYYEIIGKFAEIKARAPFLILTDYELIED